MDIGYFGAFVGGILSILSPCSVMLLPAFFAYAFTDRTKLLSRTGLFTLGLLATLIPLGVFSGVFGSLLGAHRNVLITTVAVLIMVVGALQLFAVPIPGLSRSGGADANSTSGFSVFVLGTVYAVAGVCTGPILGSVLMIASLGGSAAYGAIVLTIYALGMVVPLVIITLLWQKFGAGAMRWLRPRTLTIGRWSNSWPVIITGLLSIGLGVLLLTTEGTAKLSGLVSIDTQFAIESRIGLASQQVPDWVFIVGAIVLILVVLGVTVLRRMFRSQPARKQEA